MKRELEESGLKQRLTEYVMTTLVVAGLAVAVGYTIITKAAAIFAVAANALAR